MSESTVTDNRLLPDVFADLEPFAAEWSLPTFNERYERRLASTMPEMQAFYDVAVPRIEPAIVYLDQFQMQDLPEDALRLFWLLCSVSVISFAVDVFKQPRIPDSGGGNIPMVIEPGP